jgi:hypothetical protein
MRKIVQHSSIFLAGGYGYDPAEHVYALCDDGTLWKHITASDKWTALPPIPQDEGHETEEAPSLVTDNLPLGLAGNLFLITNNSARLIQSWKFAWETSAAIGCAENPEMALVFAHTRDRATHLGHEWLAGQRADLTEQIWECCGQAITYVDAKIPF